LKGKNISRKFFIMAIATATVVVGLSSTSEAFHLRRRLRSAVVQENFAPVPNCCVSAYGNGQSYYGNGYTNYGATNRTNYVPHNHSAIGYSNSNAVHYSTPGIDANGANSYGNISPVSATTILSQ
jgi:hypothetical protein